MRKGFLQIAAGVVLISSPAMAQTEDALVTKVQVGMTKIAERQLACAAKQSTDGIVGALEQLSTAPGGGAAALDLKREAIEFRRKNSIWSADEVVIVIEFAKRGVAHAVVDAPWADSIEGAFTPPTAPERSNAGRNPLLVKVETKMLDAALAKIGFDDKKDIRRIFGEVAPCDTESAECRKVLCEDLPNATMTYLLESAKDDIEKKARKMALEEILKMSFPGLAPKKK